MPVPAHFALRSPDRPAIVIAETGETLTYLQLDERAVRLANALRMCGLNAGDHVAYCAGNSIDTLVVAWGIHYAGCYYTPIGTSLTSEEMGYIIDDCGATVVIADEPVATTITASMVFAPAVEHWWFIGADTPRGFANLDQVMSEADPIPSATRAEGREMLYSSGTTGRPKGVKAPLPAGEFGEDEPAAKGMSALFGFDEDVVYLSPAPLYHAAPLRFCMGTHRFGGTVVVMRKFDAAATLDSIARYGVTHAQFVPTMFIRLLALPEEERVTADLSSLKVVLHAAAPCPIDVKHRMIRWWGPIVHEYYGGTEANGTTFVFAKDWLEHPGTVGRPLSGQVHILDDGGNELPTGEIGGVYFSGGNTFEYHGDPEKTASSYVSGKSTMGDVGYLDADGFLFLTDRKANLIISGGVNIYPQEAENLLAGHPAVYDVAVFGIPHDEFGEEVKAVVQPTVMPTSPEEQEELQATLISFCREHLAKVKCPRSIDFRSTLPRTETGKLLKRLVKDEYWEGRGSRII